GDSAATARPSAAAVIAATTPANTQRRRVIAGPPCSATATVSDARIPPPVCFSPTRDIARGRGSSPTNQDGMAVADETAQALWYVAPEKAEIRTEPAAAPGPGEVRVRALFGALSRGTERLVFSGRVPPSEHARMRAPHMGGAFPFPVKYGY